MNVLRAARRMGWPLGLIALSAFVSSISHDADPRGEFLFFRTELKMVSGILGYFAAAWLAGRIIGLALDSAFLRRRPVPKLLPELIVALLFLVALVGSTMLVLGHSATGVLAGAGLILAALGFSIRNVVADALSGIALGLEAPFRIGDLVEVDGLAKGCVVEFGWRTTRLQTKDATHVILPNSQIARQRLTNYSAPQLHYRAQVQVMLPCGMPIEDAKTMLARAAERARLVQRDPPPDARALSFETDGVLYAIRFWVPSFAEEVDCRDAVLSEVDFVLREHTVSTPDANITLVTAEQDEEPSQWRILGHELPVVAGAPETARRVAAGTAWQDHDREPQI